MPTEQDQTLADDLVARWHKGAGGPLDIWEYMGLTWKEYKLWAESIHNLPDDFGVRLRVHQDSLNNKYAWLVSSTWNRLHYFPGITFEDWNVWWDGPHTDPEWLAQITKTAICGRTMRTDLPGIFARMGRERCDHCCDKLGIPRGNGTPTNDHTLDNLREEV